MRDWKVPPIVDYFSPLLMVKEGKGGFENPLLLPFKKGEN
jgi:hypothetical protein